MHSDIFTQGLLFRITMLQVKDVRLTLLSNFHMNYWDICGGKIAVTISHSIVF